MDNHDEECSAKRVRAFIESLRAERVKASTEDVAELKRMFKLKKPKSVPTRTTEPAPSTASANQPKES
jgi:hypothetical protein